MSKYYNKDERFVPLMEKIGNELAARVRQLIDLRSLVSSLTLTEAIDLCHQGKNLLLRWKHEYQNTRSQLESDKRGFSAWNFDQHLLFDKTDYMSQICDDLIYMLSHLEEFYQIFGSEMKNVTEEEEMVDQFLNSINQLQQTFLTCYFDPFQRENVAQWRILIEDFRHRSALIEKEAKIFIRTAFTQLRSAETALDMLKTFEQLNTTHLLAHEMAQQFAAILVQYCKEIDEIEELFHQQKMNPPIPPVRFASDLGEIDRLVLHRIILLWQEPFNGRESCFQRSELQCKNFEQWINF